MHHFAPASLDCLGVLPATTPLADSEALGWEALLVRHSRSEGAPDVYETLPTADQLLVIVTRGELAMESFDGIWRKGIYRSGSAGLTAPGETDRLRWRTRRPGATFDKLHVFVPASLLAEAADHLRRPGRKAPRVSLSSLVFHDSGIADLARSLVSALNQGAPDFFAQAAARLLAVQLLTQDGHGDHPADRRQPGPVSDARLQRAIEYMSAHLSRAISLDDVAREAGISKFHFSRLFRERTGATPMHCLLTLRMTTASRLLRTSDLPVSIVAHECGYRNVTHFNDAFRRFHSMTPGAARRGERSTPESAVA